MPTRKILLVNPPVYDFAAFDFWLKPYGLLSVAGLLRGRAELSLFDFMDRYHPSLQGHMCQVSDPWGRGHFPNRVVAKPVPLSSVRRRFRRYGLELELFRRHLQERGPFDVALIQTVMTYWYPGVQEVMQEIRALSPGCKIVLGGVYATLCRDHAMTLGPDLVVRAGDLAPLWRLIETEPDPDGLPLWEAYPTLKTGVMKISQGCPFRCTYCSSHRLYPEFQARSLDRALSELNLLIQCGVGDVAFYDDALLWREGEVLRPLLDGVIKKGASVRFHAPNALHARLIQPEIAARMVRAGFTGFFLGFESVSPEWQRKTGDKASREDLSRAVGHLVKAGVDPAQITVYLLLGHPDQDLQDLDRSMRFVHGLGVRLLLSDFSPLPGTPDGDRCAEWVDLSEPLWHNKTAFLFRRLGEENVQGFKQLCKELNRRIGPPAQQRSLAIEQAAQCRSLDQSPDHPSIS